MLRFLFSLRIMWEFFKRLAHVEVASDFLRKERDEARKDLDILQKRFNDLELRVVRLEASRDADQRHLEALIKQADYQNQRLELQLSNSKRQPIEN